MTQTLTAKIENALKQLAELAQLFAVHMANEEKDRGALVLALQEIKESMKAFEAKLESKVSWPIFSAVVGVAAAAMAALFWLIYNMPNQIIELMQKLYS